MIRRLLLGLAVLWAVSCEQQMPTQKDGTFSLQVIAADTSGIFSVSPDLGYVPLAGSKIEMKSGLYFDEHKRLLQYTRQTDGRGMASFEDLPADIYTISVRKDTFYNDPLTGLPIQITLSGYRQCEINVKRTGPDTLFTNLSVQSGLVINEIYYCGPPNRAFYFYDQFVELYNTTDETIYLDGMIICRALQARHPEIEENDFLQAIYVYKFPGQVGKTTLCPLEAHEFTVIAQDGIDHSKYIPTALDLSGAEWEFYNPYGFEPDNPPRNVENILVNHTTDFMINLSHNAVILAYGTNPHDAQLKWYFGEFNKSGTGQYVHIPLKNVIDVVEYSSSSEYQKEITRRMDAGFAGIGMTKYSGKSVERRERGFDTNNSTLDFVIIDTPTPGWQH